MAKIKVLNLYAGIGGNRKLWKDVEVTAVELDPQIADIYKRNFPQDRVLTCDAHAYLLHNYDAYDFIWSSPPCPTHSRARYWASKGGKIEPKYPEMSIYQEIIFLKEYALCKWVVENVISYYEPLLNPKELGRHFFWSNFIISNFKCESRDHLKITAKSEIYGFNIQNEKRLNNRKDQILRNLIEPKLGLHIFNCAFKEKQETLEWQDAKQS